MLEYRGTPAGRIGRRGKVGAIPIGLSVRGEEHGQRPATMFPITPGPPVDGVAFVLEKIGASSVGEVVMPHG